MPSLIGNKPNQVPTNGDLGTLAFQDANAVNITGGIATVDRLTVDGTTLVVDSTNDRVGIGTSSPAATLHVAVASGVSTTGRQFFQASGSAAAAQFMRITNTGGDGVLGIADAGGNAIVSGGSPYATQLYTVNATSLQFGTNSTIKATLDSSGNLGLGVTPSAWASLGGPALQLGGASGNIAANTQYLNITANAYYASGYKYIGTGNASFYAQDTGKHVWFTAPSGTAGTAITFTQAMTLDASGNLLVGKTASASNVVGAQLQAAGGVWGVTSSGEALYGYRKSSTSTDRVVAVYSDSGAAQSLMAYFKVDGGLANYSANNANLSDIRTKTNIALAGNYLDKICSIPVKTFKYTWQQDSDVNLGVIAQDVEAVAPELVDVSGFGETPEDGVPLKAIYQTDLVYALMKSIQELKAEVDSLKAQLNA